MTERQYVYKITEVVKVVDGDSYWLRVDVGFRQENLINVRLMGYDCPEAHRGTPYEKERAIAAREIASQFLSMKAAVLYVRTEKDPDSFGRWLGDIWWSTDRDEEDVHIGAYLKNLRLASVWPTRWREEFGEMP